MERRAGGWKHAFVYAWLAIVTSSVVAGGSLSDVEMVASLALLGALGGWYGYWYVYVPRVPGREVDGRAYLVGAVVLWALLVAVDPSFVIVGVSVAAGRSFNDLRWALALLVLCAAIWVWQSAAAGELDGRRVAVALLFLACGATAVGYTRTLANQNAERQRLIDQLEAAQTELAAAERRAGVLAERQRLARDIHDTLTQGFASIVMLLEAAQTPETSPEVGARHVAAAQRSARDNLAESRRLVWALRPDALGDVGLPDALGELVERLGEDTGLHAELVVTGTPRLLGQDTEITLLRIAQESLANVRKHARARRVTVTVSYMDDVTVLDVQDDGLGFRPPGDDRPGVSGGGIGLRGMRERAEELGGRLAIETALGEGTTVAVEVPARPHDATPSSRQRQGTAERLPREAAS